jgi:hypothetical protein
VQLRAGKILSGFGKRRNKVRMFGAGERKHGVAVWKRREVLLQFMWRAAGGNEMDFVEIETPISCACHCKMSIVDGVEGAAKQRNAAGLMSSCNAALRLRGGQ